MKRVRGVTVKGNWFPESRPPSVSKRIASLRPASATAIKHR